MFLLLGSKHQPDERKDKIEQLTQASAAFRLVIRLTTDNVLGVPLDFSISILTPTSRDPGFSNKPICLITIVIILFIIVSESTIIGRCNDVLSMYM